MANFHANVEDFAVLRAEIEDPFGDRPALLAVRGLDEPSYAALINAWRARFADGTPSGNAIAKRFAAAYRSAVARRTQGEARQHPEEDARFLSKEPQAWRAEAARVALSTEDAPPAPVDVIRPLLAAPPMAPIVSWSQAPEPTFEASDFDPAEPSKLSVAPETKPPQTLPVPDTSFETTAPIPVALLSKPVLPFVSASADQACASHPILTDLPFRSGEQPPSPPAAPAAPASPMRPAEPMSHYRGPVLAEGQSAPPGKRLIRFDSQTGQPLPSPIWVDAVPDLSKSKR
jgi:hypothetical protein